MLFEVEWGTRKRAALATRGSYDVLLLQRASLVTRRWRNAQRAAAAMSNAPLQQRAAVATRQYSIATRRSSNAQRASPSSCLCRISYSFLPVSLPSLSMILSATLAAL